MKILLLNAKERKVTVEEFDKPMTLADLYIMLDCDCIDITQRTIGGKVYDIIVDDEGLLKDKPILSAASITDVNDILVGNLILCDYNEEGEEIGLTDERIRWANKHIHLCTDKNGIDFPLLFLD